MPLFFYCFLIEFVERILFTLRHFCDIFKLSEMTFLQVPARGVAFGRAHPKPCYYERGVYYADSYAKIGRSDRRYRRF